MRKLIYSLHHFPHTSVIVTGYGNTHFALHFLRGLVLFIGQVEFKASFPSHFPSLKYMPLYVATTISTGATTSDLEAKLKGVSPIDS